MNMIELGIIAILGLYAVEALPEPLQLNPAGCGFYAQDAGKIAAMRDGGISEESTKEAFAAMPYHPDVRPHLASLIHFVYTSSLTASEATAALYDERMRNKGKIVEDL